MAAEKFPLGIDVFKMTEKESISHPSDELIMCSLPVSQEVTSSKKKGELEVTKSSKPVYMSTN
jgi:hypothetical protein